VGRPITLFPQEAPYWIFQWARVNNVRRDVLIQSLMPFLMDGKLVARVGIEPHGCLAPLKTLFKWLAREKSHPLQPGFRDNPPEVAGAPARVILAALEVESIFREAEPTNAQGLRDRAISEGLYSTAVEGLTGKAQVVGKIRSTRPRHGCASNQTDDGYAKENQVGAPTGPRPNESPYQASRESNCSYYATERKRPSLLTRPIWRIGRVSCHSCTRTASATRQWRSGTL